LLGCGNGNRQPPTRLDPRLYFACITFDDKNVAHISPTIISVSAAKGTNEGVGSKPVTFSGVSAYGYLEKRGADLFLVNDAGTGVGELIAPSQYENGILYAVVNAHIGDALSARRFPDFRLVVTGSVDEVNEECGQDVKQGIQKVMERAGSLAFRRIQLNDYPFELQANRYLLRNIEYGSDDDGVCILDIRGNKGRMILVRLEETSALREGLPH
jgi:hypothetical protein